MPPRRGATYSNTLSPQDPASLQPPPSPSSTAFPRSNSPSGGFTQLLTKPSKWFMRSSSASKVPTTTSPDQPRSSTSSTRKHKISRPTDPRPILENYGVAASRSVLDLSARPQGSLDIQPPHPGSTPSSPAIGPSYPSPGLGDLRSISRKGWSKSADDLSQLSPGHFSPGKPAFHEKIHEYRNRSNSTAALTPTSPTGSPVPPPSRPVPIEPSYGTGPRPFPTMTASPGTSPPRSATLPTVSISVSAPTMDDHHPNSAYAGSPKLVPGQLGQQPNQQPGQVHNRSHSFTPKLPSKLMAPRLVPGSPKRKGSNASERDAESPAERSPVSANRSSTFPFPFSGSGGAGRGAGNNNHVFTAEPMSYQSSSGSHRATALLAPPSIEVDSQHLSVSDTDRSSKRSSQVVSQSGFLNRLTDVPNHHYQNPSHLSLAKGWKSFKVELKGSKLHFYKPPSDRSHGIKDLFPTTLVPAVDDEDEADTDSGPGADHRLTTADPFGSGGRGGGGRRSEDILAGGGSIGRKKRAFWGRRTHPDLVAANGRVEKGSFEALVHECVFATTFVSPVATPEASASELSVETTSTEEKRERWRDFASTVLLCLPSIVGKARFEAEFLRCCSYLVSGASDEEQPAEREKVSWLAAEYLRAQGQPADPRAWEEWQKDTIPDFSALTLTLAVAQAKKPGFQASPSIQGLHPSPLLSESPNIGTFSPRPEAPAPNSISLLAALDGQDVVISSSIKRKNESVDPKTLDGRNAEPKSASALSRMPWTALQQEGLSRDVLRMLDPHLVAHSLILFHRSMLDQTPDNISADFVIDSDMLDAEEAASSTSQTNPAFAVFFGTDDKPNWLTKLVLLQVLGADSAHARGASSEPKMTRSDVITFWILVGELCRSAGDEVSWRAIYAALCSRPIARLDKTWRGVSKMALTAIESWVYPNPSSKAGVGSEQDMSNVREPRITPWAGDIRSKIREVLIQAVGEGDEQSYNIRSLEAVKEIFEGFRRTFLLCPRRVPVVEGEVSEESRRLVAYWRDMASAGGGVGNLAAKFQRVDQFMSLSFAVEPKRKGHFEPYFWSRPTSGHAQPATLLPLLFPEVAPTLTFVDRTQLVRGRVDSDAADTHFLHGHERRPDDRRVPASPTAGLSNLNQGGTVIPVYGGDLLLVVQSGSGTDSVPPSRPVSSRSPSRPTSSVAESIVEKPLGRTPSIRVKPGASQGLDRKTSVARRSSLPSISHGRPNFTIQEKSTEPPLRVIVQAGTLNNLVNILVFGLQNVSVSVADDNGEMSLREDVARELYVDRPEFAKIWWGTFRSFVSPLVFFELLRKLYITSQPFGSSPPASEYVHVFNTKREVIDTMKEWLTVGGGAQDILDDGQLVNAVQNFLDSPMDHNVVQGKNFKNPDVQQCWARLNEGRNALRIASTSHTARPLATHGQPQPRTTAKIQHPPTRTHTLSKADPPDFDHINAEEFVDNLDGMAQALLSKVAEDDMYAMADLVEVQSGDRVGWFSNRDAPSSEDAIDIQTIHTHVMEVESSPMLTAMNQDAIYRLLPPSIRSCFRAFLMIRKWLVSKIVAPQLGLKHRQARMELLLRVLEIARWRNMPPGTVVNRLAEAPCVRSFVEAVVTSAIISSESRCHIRAWQNVASGRGVQCDSVVALLSKSTHTASETPDPLAPDMGWILDRLLEIIATPDVLENNNQDSNLINLDKRRNLVTFLDKALALPALQKRTFADEFSARGFDRLTRAEEEVQRVQFDLRSIREDAAREAMSASGSASNKKLARPFQKLVVAQLEKNRRDRNLRARFQKEKLQEQARLDKRDEMLNRAMRPRKQPSVSQKHRNKKSMSAFLQFMRPISSAFGADMQQTSGTKKTAAELDFTPSGKPVLVLSLMDARVAQFINNERSFTFQLDTEDGGHYILQALNRKDMTKWIETISRITNLAAKRRLTYLGSSPKPQASDHFYKPVAASRDPRAVFGVELEYLLRREYGGSPPVGAIPSVMSRCLDEIEGRGLTEIGIYRIAGAVSEINGLKDTFNRGENPDLSEHDIHAVCDLVKSWFRTMPEPLFPTSVYHDVIRAMQLDNLDARLSQIRGVIQSLPQANFDLLKRVSEHLDRVTDYEEQNHMTAEALAIVFSPNLMRAPQNDFAVVLNNMGHAHKLVKALITHFHVIFDDEDEHDVEGHSEEEYDSPIPEEDEEEESS